MRVRTARLLVDGLPHDVVAALEIVPGALSRYQVAADPRFAEAGGDAVSTPAGGEPVAVPGVSTRMTSRRTSFLVREGSSICSQMATLWPARIRRAM